MSRRGWFLVHVALVVGASAAIYLIKPEIWLVGLMFGAMCVMYAWMWLVGKVARRVEAVVARRKGLTPEQYEANKPIFRFDLGGWPFQKQGRSERREFNAWILLVGVTSAYMLGKYLSTL